METFVLVDGYASQNLPSKLIKDMKTAGVRFRWFEPILRSRNFYIGRRLHHKVFVADAAYSMVGGMNIGDRYNDLPDSKAWLDWAIFTEGEVSNKLFLVCQKLWNKSGWGKKRKEIITRNPEIFPVKETCQVRIRRQDWVRRQTEITSTFLRMFKNAQHEIIMMSSYFIPGRHMRKSLEAASARGVKIHVITTGKSDVLLAKQAERYLYQWLLRNKISLYEYESNILHGKISCYDKTFVTAGSFNINFISSFASIELNLDINDQCFASKVHDQMESIIANDCTPITEKVLQKKYSLFSRIRQRLSYDFIRLLFYLFTFYFRQRK